MRSINVRNEISKIPLKGEQVRRTERAKSRITRPLRLD